MTDDIEIKKKMAFEFEEGFLLGVYYGSLNALGPLVGKRGDEIDRAVATAAAENNIEYTDERGAAITRAHARMLAKDKELQKKVPHLNEKAEAMRKQAQDTINSSSSVTLDENALREAQARYNEEEPYVPQDPKKKKDDPAYR